MNVSQTRLCLPSQLFRQKAVDLEAFQFHIHTYGSWMYAFMWKTDTERYSYMRLRKCSPADRYYSGSYCCPDIWTFARCTSEKITNLFIKASEMYLVQISLRLSDFPVCILKSCEGRAKPEKYDRDIVSERHRSQVALTSCFSNPSPTENLSISTLSSSQTDVQRLLWSWHLLARSLMMLKQCVWMVSRTRQSGKGRDRSMREDWSLTLQKAGWGYRVIILSKNQKLVWNRCCSFIHVIHHTNFTVA